MYSQIVFLSGDEADEYLEMYKNHGEEKVVESLKKYDTGNHNLLRKSSAGNRDKVHRVGLYVLSVNLPMRYLGLEKIVAPTNYFNHGR